MMLFTHEIQPADVRHLHCTDPRVADEVAAAAPKKSRRLPLIIAGLVLAALIA